MLLDKRITRLPYRSCSFSTAFSVSHLKACHNCQALEKEARNGPGMSRKGDAYLLRSRKRVSAREATPVTCNKLGIIPMRFMLGVMEEEIVFQLSMPTQNV